MKRQLDSYFAGKLMNFDLPVQYEGTPFQMKVWKYLQAIPYGKTVSYLAVAKAIGHPKSTRAVGTACKRNPIPIIIPCHRVISSSGKFGEYAGGKTRKTKLLKLEGG
jgi:methylated-DNA-[protein]-cysteine S-methyltransferase